MERSNEKYRLLRGHESRGYDVARFLNFLNEEENDDAPAFLEVFKLCRQLDKFHRQLAGAVKSIKVEDYNRIISQQTTAEAAASGFLLQPEFSRALVKQMYPVGAALNKLNNLLQKFHFIPVLVGPGVDPYKVLWTGLPGQGDEPNTIPTANFVQVLLETTEDGTLERVRQCFCGRWFFAQTTKKIVCSDACRFQKFKQGDQKTFNKERAAYMRKYRNNPRVKAQKRRGDPNAKTKARKQ